MDLAERVYEVQLEQFTGPMDLLLHLIKKEEIDIYDIPIARITQQYLEYVEMMQLLDLEVASGFIVMAATLMRIKSRTLLPRPEEELPEDEDPRRELADRLMEYRLYQDAAATLKHREQLRLKEFLRGQVPEVEAFPPELEPVSLFSLLEALRQSLKRMEGRLMSVESEEIKIEEKIEELVVLLSKGTKISLSELVESSRTRTELIMYFLALLELIRLGQAVAMQNLSLNDVSNVRARVEALLFASPTALSVDEIVQSIEGITQEEVLVAVEELRQAYDSPDHGVKLVSVAGGYQVCTKPEYAHHVQTLFQERKEIRLSKAALETVAIVAYKQPITKPEIEEIRGVDVGGVLHTLLERELIEIKGRSKAVGRPLLYGTGNNFLNYFGLDSLDDMPSMDELESLMKDG
jgi:segregation and condensation protein A